MSPVLVWLLMAITVLTLVMLSLRFRKFMAVRCDVIGVVTISRCWAVSVAPPRQSRGQRSWQTRTRRAPTKRRCDRSGP